MTQLTTVPLNNTNQLLNNQVIGQLTQQTNSLNTSVTSLTSSVSKSLVAINPKNYGAFGDGNSHPITATDVANNPQWIGPFHQSPLKTYPVGTEWDTVAIQEAIYAAFAQTSTPGNIKWNSPIGGTNSRFFCPSGSYLINRQIWFAAQGFTFEFEDRLSTGWFWTGYARFTCNSHTSTTLDGISASDIAKLFVGQWLFDTTSGVVAVGSIPANTKITAINASAGSITISNATTSTVTGLVVSPQTSVFQCDSVAYGNFRNVQLQANAQLLTAGDQAGPSEIGLWVIDRSGAVGGLKPQQLTLYDIVIFGNLKANYGLIVCPQGPVAQGDTITYINPFISDCWQAGVVISSSNSLSHNFINGDFQACYNWGINLISGSFYLNGTSFQNQLLNLSFSPQLGQIPAITADVFCGSGGGATSTCGLHDVRSEASVGIISQNNGIATNYALAGADQFNWFASFPFQLLTMINPSSNNTKNRSFCCVDTGGNNQWLTGTGAGDVITASGSPGWTVNQWAGFSLYFRFGSSGFTEHFTGGVTSNTTNTLTASGTGIGDSMTPASLFSITTQTSSSAPNFDSASGGKSTLGAAFAAGHGFSITAGSSTATANGAEFSGLSVGDYIIIPGAELFGTYVADSQIPQLTIPFVAKVTAIPGGLPNITMSRIPSYSGTFLPGWFGTPLNDNGVKWLEIPYISFQGLRNVIDCVTTNGIVSGVFDIRGLQSARNDTLYGVTNIPAGTGSPNNSIGVDGGPSLRPVVALATSTPLDLTTYFQAANVLTLTPTQAMTLNAPSPVSKISQEITLIILTSGVSSFNLTFGTNFTSAGVLATGGVTGKYWIVKFVTDGTSWVEVSRIGPL